MRGSNYDCSWFQIEFHSLGEVYGYCNICRVFVFQKCYLKLAINFQLQLTHGSF